MSEYHRLRDQKYAEAEYLFQAIEMGKSDEEFDVELCSTPPSHTLELMGNDPQSIYSWKLVKRRQPRRRYTVSHGGGAGTGGNSSDGVCQIGGSGCSSLQGITISTGSLPPAPPSTPTSLTPTNTSLLSSATCSNMFDDSDTADKFRPYYILKYKKKLRDQQRTDAELADLFNVVSLAGTSSTTSATSKIKLQPERGVSSTSRNIRKPDSRATKIFKLHRNLQEFFKETDEEDSVSAPEYDTEEEDIRFNRLSSGRRQSCSKYLNRKRQLRLSRFEQRENMEAMVDIFDEAMNFNETLYNMYVKFITPTSKL